MNEESFVWDDGVNSRAFYQFKSKQNDTVQNSKQVLLTYFMQNAA